MRPNKGDAADAARATRSPNRANLRCLGLAAGIAIALAGCSRAAFEANPIGYATVAGYADMEFGHATVLARKALSDGYLTNAEYNQVVEAADAVREAEYRLTRDRAIAKWSAQ